MGSLRLGGMLVFTLFSHPIYTLFSKQKLSSVANGHCLHEHYVDYAGNVEQCRVFWVRLTGSEMFANSELQCPKTVTILRSMPEALNQTVLQLTVQCFIQSLNNFRKVPKKEGGS